MADLLDQNTLRQLLKYNPSTGEFIRLSAKFTQLINKPAGNISKTTGYLRIYVLGKTYLAHRLAWLYVYGSWPKGYIDHIDMDRLNNKIENLRVCNISKNAQNRGKTRINTSGAKGVTLRKNGRYEASIEYDGIYQYLGRFDTLEEARSAYNLAAIKYHKEFSRF